MTQKKKRLQKQLFATPCIHIDLSRFMCGIPCNMKINRSSSWKYVEVGAMGPLDTKNQGLAARLLMYIIPHLKPEYQSVCRRSRNKVRKWPSSTRLWQISEKSTYYIDVWHVTAVLIQPVWPWWHPKKAISQLLLIPQSSITTHFFCSLLHHRSHQVFLKSFESSYSKSKEGVHISGLSDGDLTWEN